VFQFQLYSLLSPGRVNTFPVLFGLLKKFKTSKKREEEDEVEGERGELK